ncbi:mas-related G-protein coupled receptor member X1-like [Callospermophilus lateralis]|uniref:mas-related G-protein coupled receptor member X1-like n=1 Tax=Callospermophilus lateralis TaxID=76772 RepID=UPI0040540146
MIPKALTFTISLVWLTRNASVIWFLGFRMHRNAFYTYILNMAVADFLYLLPYSAWLVLLFVVLSGSSLALLGRMFCGSQKKPLNRLCVTIMLTVLVFLFSGLPFGVFYFLYYWIKNSYDLYYCLYLVSSVLSCVNSSANPIIYFFVGSYRQCIQERNLEMVLERALQDTPEEDECGGSLSQGTLEMSGSRVEQG